MIFHKSTYNDIQKYYTDNIVKFKETGDRLWHIVSIRPDEIKCIDADGFEIHIDLNEEYEVDYPLPGRVVYQDGSYACLLSRKPAKQYNRGIHTQNTSVQFLRKAGDWANYGMSLQKLQQFVDKPAYQTVETIDWDCGYESWALNRYFAVSKLGAIKCLSKTIGAFDFNTKKIKLSSSLFKSEVKSLFPGWEFV